MADAASLATLASRFIETDTVPWIENAPGHKSKVIYYDFEDRDAHHHLEA